MIGNSYSARAQESAPRLVPDDSSDEGHEKVVDEPEYPLTSTDLEPVDKIPAMPQSANAQDQVASMPAPAIMMVEGQAMSSHTSSLHQAAVMPTNPMIMVGDRVVLPHTSGLPRDATASSDPNSGKLGDGNELDDDDEDGALPEPDDPMSLEDLLYCYGISHADENVGVRFWPYAKLRSVMTRERVLRALHEECGFDQAEAQNYCSRIVPASDDADTETLAADSIRWRKPEEPHTTQRAEYLRIFAILILQKKGALLRNFIEQGVSDRELPLKALPPTRRTKGGIRLVLPEEPSPRPQGCFQRHELNMFISTQWRFVPPYFAPSASGDAAHYDLPPEAILPWVEIKSASAGQSTWKEEEGSGGYGIVKRVRIHPDCHSLGTLLGSSSLPDRFFAIKSLRKQDLGEFTKEVEMLKRFSGTGHPHLVTLLSTFTHLGSYHFIFPWAKGDLDQWWSRSIKPPPNKLKFRQWIARQISGLADAMHAIHEPKQGNSNLSPDEKRFGRHGDLKPENVLWFASSRDEMGILVIADFGISAVHRDISRSNVPNENLPRTPAYRPPECDMEGGKIARAFDIWTMGCIFLEMVAWLLGGAEGRATFKRERRALYLATVPTDIYFDIQEMPRSNGMTGGSGKYVFMVKEGVTKYIEKLHAHPACTDYLHGLLKLVHEDMLVIISPTRQRIRARPLSDKLKTMCDRAMGDDPAYILAPAPWPGFRVDRQPAVEAPLIENARRLLDGQDSRSGRAPTVFAAGATEIMTVSQFTELQGD